MISNLHGAQLADVNAEIWVQMSRVAQKIAAAIRNSDVKCEGVNLFLADGEAAGQDVFHSHIHIFPRFAGDGFGFKFGPNYGNKPPRAALDAVAEQIKTSPL